MNKVVVLGTNHNIQQGKVNKDSFHSYIKELCVSEDIKVIAEEINDNATVAVAKNVCDELSIDHIIIDPNPLDYDSLGVTPYHKIEYQVMTKYDLEIPPSFENPTPDEASLEFNKRIANEHNHPREMEWWRRIESNNCWPVLVICGSAHFCSFCNLLSENGVEVIRNSKNWVA